MLNKQNISIFESILTSVKNAEFILLETNINSIKNISDLVDFYKTKTNTLEAYSLVADHLLSHT